MHNFWLAEILLALAAALVASQYWYIARERCQSPALLVVAGLICLSLAAAVGAWRYGMDPGVTALHRALSQLSGYISFLLIGLGLLWAWLRLSFGLNSRAPAYATLAVVIGSALGLAESGYLSAQDTGTLFSVVGLLLWLLVALGELLRGGLAPSRAPLLAAGAALVVLAGLFIGSSPQRLLGVARINWFHLLLALSTFSLLLARPLFDWRKAS